MSWDRGQQACKLYPPVVHGRTSANERAMGEGGQASPRNQHHWLLVPFVRLLRAMPSSIYAQESVPAVDLPEDTQDDFPPLTKADVLACVFSAWYPALRKVSPKASIIKPLEDSFIDYLESDRVFIPAGSGPLGCVLLLPVPARRKLTTRDSGSASSATMRMAMRQIAAEISRGR